MSQHTAKYSRFGWSKNPFTLHIDPGLLVGYGNELQLLKSNIEEQQKYILVTGPTGAGKTTILKWISNKYDTLYLPKPPTNPEEFVAVFKDALLKPSLFHKIFHVNNLTIYTLGEKLNHKLKDRHLVMLVDEAHETTIQMLEWIRSLSDQAHNMTVILVGLPKLKHELLKELETLGQRITLDIELRSLTKDEMVELIRKRIEHAGGSSIDPFTVDALNEIYERTGGFPREVLKLCNQLTQQAVEREVSSIDATFFHAINPRKQETAGTMAVFTELTDKQKQILSILSKTDGVTPPQLVKALFNDEEYASETHALRAINNILKRLETGSFISREKKGRTYVYKLLPKTKSLVVEA